MAKISVLGSGGWGTALAILSADNKHETVMWGKFEDEMKYLNFTRKNPLLEGVIIPSEIELTSDIQKIVGSDIVIIATPSFAVRENAKLIAPLLSKKTVVVSVAKGFERDTLERFSQVIKTELKDNEVVVLSGPSHAEEVGRKIPTSIVAACENEESARYIQECLSNTNFRVYTNSDVIGVEVGAALKNIIAVAAGICDGLKLGDNTIAALITRGIKEISQLGTILGANERTFAGLSGIGDLIVTCTSIHSRNRRFGKLIGEGKSVDKALEAVGMTVEGYFATKAAKMLADKYELEMPIVDECYEILYNNSNVQDAICNLMNRDFKSE